MQAPLPTPLTPPPPLASSLGRGKDRSPPGGLCCVPAAQHLFPGTSGVGGPRGELLPLLQHSFLLSGSPDMEPVLLPLRALSPSSVKWADTHSFCLRGKGSRPSH